MFLLSLLCWLVSNRFERFLVWLPELQIALSIRVPNFVLVRPLVADCRTKRNVSMAVAMVTRRSWRRQCDGSLQCIGETVTDWLALVSVRCQPEYRTKSIIAVLNLNPWLWGRQSVFRPSWKDLNRLLPIWLRLVKTASFDGLVGIWVYFWKSSINRGEFYFKANILFIWFKAKISASAAIRLVSTRNKWRNNWHFYE